MGIRLVLSNCPSASQMSGAMKQGPQGHGLVDVVVGDIPSSDGASSINLFIAICGCRLTWIYHAFVRRLWKCADFGLCCPVSGSSGGRSGEWAAGLSDFSSLEDFADSAPITNDDAADDSAWGASGYHLSDAPDRCVCTSYTRQGLMPMAFHFCVKVRVCEAFRALAPGGQ